MKIAVIGSGYVGLVVGTCFANTGNRVRCVDVDQRKRIALGLGAQSYCSHFEVLFQAIERVLAPGEETV